MSGKTKPRIYTLFYSTPITFVTAIDYEARRDFLFNKLKSSFDNFEFVGGEFFDFRESLDVLKKAAERDDIDAILVYLISIIPTGARWYTRDESDIAPFRNMPMIWVVDTVALYPMGYVGMDFYNRAKKEKLPFLAVQSSRFEDVERPLHLAITKKT